ncbi:hypothetical protein BDY19DRAFT_331995 [Irpex rosettiformis]|uniref:Uncharacterized protein n=1 Tax=Irpex rosettiformis TaxID=378272 RepID=A0ACB8TXV8_9APHY|nr:hypothetical protein BDY19DRAFT_331995 [Irpex rosettiformis]
MKSSWLLAAVSAVSLLPMARADCFVDEFGEHCRLNDGVRIGIAITIVVVALLIIASALRWRQRSGRTTFLAFQRPVNQQNVSYGNGTGNYPSGYNVQGGYYPNGPQYPPHQYNSYAPPAKPYGPPDDMPPPAYYAPPAGPPPAVTKGDMV